MSFLYGKEGIMTIEIALLISIVSVAFSVYNIVKNAKRNDTKDIESRATESAVLNVKLDQIGSDVRDIKYDITSVKSSVQGLAERMIKVEESVKQAHRRINDITEKEK